MKIAWGIGWFSAFLGCGLGNLGAGESPSLETIPANRWVTVHEEDNSGGKTFARAIYAESTGRVYLWGTGGKKPARNVYLRYELERFDPGDPGWEAGFPESKRGEWTPEEYPPFRIYGQSGPDGLKYDEGPRLQTVGGYHSTNRVRWWDFEGVRRPSPVSTFNMACWDSKRGRIVYYADGITFALDPKTNTWTDLAPPNYPATCKTVAWANMAYDAGRDRVVLIGGGLATNPTGAAPTWVYDCAENRWDRPRLTKEPPPRCNAGFVCDFQHETLVLFGGYDQAAALNDTWVFDCRESAWERREPENAPPPMFAPAAVALPGGKVLVCGNDARKVRRSHEAQTSANRETWVYDAAKNVWTPLDGGLELVGYSWLTATGSADPNVVLMVASGPRRKTLAFRYDPSGEPAELEGAKPNTVAWKYREQRESLAGAEKPDPKAQGDILKNLPANRFVDAKPPGMLVSKTWSTAVIDSDRSEVIYHGGGHSGYSGNDFARYDIAANRWSQDAPPRFPPFLEGTNAGIFGWSYGMVPFSQHTYLWYDYDPVSKSVVYLARPSLRDGIDVQLTDDPKDTFVYDSKRDGYATWVYDPAEKIMRRPSFGRTFKNPWHLSVKGTPRGVFVMCEGTLYRGEVERGSGKARWEVVDEDFPKADGPIKYHYEFQPLIYDSKRDRLVLLKGDDSRVDVFARSLGDDGTWEPLKTVGEAAIGREAVYIPGQDVILWLGDRLYAFDCATGRVGPVDVELPKGSYGHECAMVYDRAHDVCVALIPTGFSGPMGTYLFRYRKDIGASR